MSENVPNIGPMKIQIRKGLGITHALKELVEKQKMELSDGKITAKEWNSVLDKLIEIQQNRQASGKSSIFGGGTDKTRAGWHNSFVVHPNQEIEFTAEEAAELYEAIGAKFTKNSAPVTTEPPTAPADTTETTPPAAPAPTAPADTTETTPPAAPAPTAPADTTETTPPAAPAPTAPADTTETTPPAAPAPTAPADSTGTTPPAAPAPTAPADTTETTPPAAPAPTAPKTELPEGVTEEKRTDEDGDEYTAQIKDGKEIKRDYGGYYVTVEYDEKGIKTRELETHDLSDKIQYERLYDADGNMTKRISNREDGTIVNIEEHENGKMVKDTYYEEDGKTVSEAYAYEYDVDGKESKMTNTSGDGTVSRIRESQNGKMVKDTYYEEDGKTVSETYAYEYDADGKQAKKTFTRGDGTTGNEIEYEDGKIVKETYYEEDGKTVNRAYAYEYDVDGKESKITKTRGDGTVSEIRESQNGKIVKDTYYEEDGKTVNRAYAYEYDADGKQAKKTFTRGDGTTEYEIEYDKDDKETKKVTYMLDGKSVKQIVTDGKLEYQSITAPNKTIYKYHYNKDEICVSSGLADALKEQISGPSLNSNTIALLKQITPENVIKVLTSYKATAKESLEDAIKAEWGMGQEEIDEYINKALAARKELFHNNNVDNLTLEELAKLDSAYTRIINS